MDSGHYWSATGFTGAIARAALRTLQFSLAVVIAAIYGVDLARATRSHSSADSGFIYADVTAALSALTCIVHCFVTIKRVAWIVWDLVLCVLWAAEFGNLGSRFLGSEAAEPENADASASVHRVRAGVWLAMLCMILWFLSFLQGTVWCCTTRKITRKTEVVEDVKEQDEGITAKQMDML